MKNKKVYVVATSLHRADAWARSIGHRISPTDFRYVTDVWTLKGVQDITIVLLDGWSCRDDGEKLALLVDTLERIGRAEVIIEQNFQKESQNSEDISGQRQETSESQ